jgi:hypothetical protein
VLARISVKLKIVVSQSAWRNKSLSRLSAGVDFGAFQRTLEYHWEESKSTSSVWSSKLCVSKWEILVTLVEYPCESETECVSLSPYERCTRHRW